MTRIKIETYAVYYLYLEFKKHKKGIESTTCKIEHFLDFEYDPITGRLSNIS